MNDITGFKPEVLETACEWTAKDVADPTQWTEHLSPAEVDELDEAVQHAFGVSDDFLKIGKAEFPLPTLGPRLKARSDCRPDPAPARYSSAGSRRSHARSRRSLC